MYHDIMKQTNKANESNLIEIGRMLGLNKKDIEDIINPTPTNNEQILFTIGPDDPVYPASYYGTISIKDFQN